MTYQIRNYRKNYKKGEQPIEQTIVLGIFKALWWVISLPFNLARKKNSHINVQPVDLDLNFVKTKWQEIESLVKLGRPSNFTQAILEADKLLDHILKGLRAPGLTMADRLKFSRNRFSVVGYQSAWEAHKVRNEIVHNTKYTVTDFVTKEAINNFGIAINELINF